MERAAHALQPVSGHTPRAAESGSDQTSARPLVVIRSEFDGVCGISSVEVVRLSLGDADSHGEMSHAIGHVSEPMG